MQDGKQSEVSKEFSSPRRVLVVDDNEDVRETCASILRIRGYEVCTAYNGQTALDTVAAFRPHIVLLDILMPGVNGFKVAESLRAGPEGKDIVLISISAWADEATVWHSRQAGFDHHLGKPVDYDLLETLLTKVVEQS
jgi:CheY-like chemotaxis protein